MIITRRQVLDAVKYEPLKAGQWIHEGRTDEKTGKCPVCAVGATLRRAGVKDCDIDVVASRLWDISHSIVSNEFIQESLSNGHYLLALTQYFEGTVRRRYGSGSPAARKALVNFVKKHFPVKFKFDAGI